MFGWLFDDDLVYLNYLSNICKKMQSECIHQAMLPQNSGGQACSGPAHAAKVISDLLDSTLQSVPSAFRCRRWEPYKHKDTNEPLQFLLLKSAITVFSFEIQKSFGLGYHFNPQCSASGISESSACSGTCSRGEVKHCPMAQPSAAPHNNTLWREYPPPVTICGFKCDSSAGNC